jgi:hypothetical protein
MPKGNLPIGRKCTVMVACGCKAISDRLDGKNKHPMPRGCEFNIQKQTNGTLYRSQPPDYVQLDSSSSLIDSSKTLKNCEIDQRSHSTS